MLKFTKEEKVVLTGGILIIVLVVILGFAKQTLVDKKKEPFQAPANSEVSDNTNQGDQESEIKGIKLKKDKFTVEVNSKLDKKVASYVNANTDQMKDITIDFDGVDTTKIGEYKAKLTYKKEKIEILIVVQDSKPPVISVSNPVVEFTMEPNSSIDEIITFVNASVEDNYDGVISSDKIKGWPTELSKTEQTKVYTLSVEDSNGNKGEKDITVIYIIPSNDASTQTPTE